MEITEKENNYIITPLSSKLTERETLRLSNEIEDLKREENLFDIGLDMSYVQDCTIDFLTLICKFTNISLFNIQSDIFAVLTSMNLDKKINLYVSELDFLNKKHKLINRKFQLI